MVRQLAHRHRQGPGDLEWACARGGAKRGSVSGSRGESQDGGRDGEIGEEKSAKLYVLLLNK